MALVFWNLIVLVAFDVPLINGVITSEKKQMDNGKSASQSERARRPFATDEHVISMGLSPKGEFLVCSTWDGSLYVFSAGTGKQCHSISKDGKRRFANIVFHKDRNLFACHRDPAIEIWDAESGQMLRKTQDAHEYTLKLNNGTFLVGHHPKDEDTITLWNWDAKQTLAVKLNRKLFNGEAETCHVAFSPDAKALATCGHYSALETYDTTTGKRIRRFTEKTPELTWVTYSPDGSAIATSCSKDGKVRIWNAADGTLKQQFKASGDYIEQIRFSPDGKILAACGNDTWIGLFDPDSGKPIREIKTGERTNCMVFSPDSKALFTAGQTVRRWNVQTGTEIK